VKLLEPFAEKASGRIPKFKLSLDANTKLEQAVPHVTADYFAGWQAYAGSQIGLNRREQGCGSIRTAMRPIAFQVARQGVKALDPWEGDYWQAEVYVLRAWWYTLPCETPASSFLN